jgi:hypothetical protein
LRAKTGSPQVGPTHMAPNMAQPPTMQRAIMNRHHQARRSNSNIAPKLEPGVPLQSPQLRPTPSSHVSSPTSNSPGFSNPGVMTPPASDSQTQHQRLQGPKSIPGNPALLTNPGVIGTSLGPKGQAVSGSGSSGGTPIAAAHYPSPFQNYRNQNFRNHIEQLGKSPSSLFKEVLGQELICGYRTGVRIAGRHGRRSRPRRVGPWPIPRILLKRGPPVEPAIAQPAAAAGPADSRSTTAGNEPRLQLDDAAPGSIRPDARHGPLWPLCEHAIPHTIFL